ncbi:sulfatase-like hydrolase/transferase [Staphylothermus hellenicus]|uniref:Sulfatase n=1 Tax=Staphylothermus hellenicus (strain DSM 12710 / JCM 10830 / BK20S6-10-b1 / P8) TaxID=591019 RepID=D7D8A6_STAHD|nr:sulfatase-like hydrolase/transferase [Staphylothermus hellenicus]ADI32002.1 sulfatase [Staphylothermus hellenicus DSM 12710]
MLRKPNIVFVTIDTLRYDEANKMHFLRKIASRGILFKEYYANGPATQFSFPSIHTSLPPLWRVKPDKYNGVAIWRRTTLAEVLKRFGYRTIAFVDNPYISSYYGYSKGFDLFIDLQEYWRRIEKKRIWVRSLTGMKQSFNPLRIPERVIKWLMYHRALSAKNVDFASLLIAFIDILQYKILSINPERMPTVRGEDSVRITGHILQRYLRTPLFLWIHIMDAHDNGFGSYAPPLNRLSTLRELYILARILRKVELRTKREDLLNNEILTLLKKLRVLALKYVDLVLAKLFALLEKLISTLGDTILIITSDHGESFLEHGELYHGTILYNELLKVPLILYGAYPDDLDEITGKFSSHMDFGKMVFKILGKNEQKLWEYLNIPSLTANFYSRRAGVFAECWWERKISYAYITKCAKTIVTFYGNNVYTELYDIIKDPNEKVNIADSNPDLLKEHLNILRKHILLEGHIALTKRLHDYLKKGV